jgi:CHAD domain-containing protein
MPKPQRVRGLSPQVSTAEAARRILTARLSDVTQQEEGLPALAPTHAMRVASRRLRQALKLFGLPELDAPVKRLQDSLGELRDLQLQANWLAPRDQGLQRQRTKLVPKAEKALGAVLAAFRGETVPGILRAVQKLGGAGKLGGHRMRKKLKKRVGRFDDRLDAALENPKPRPMHRLRIAAKQLRYTCELLESAVQPARPLLAELAPLQQALGDLHDADVRIALLRRHHRAALLREEQEVRERLAAVIEKELARWKSRGISTKARRALR